MSGRRSNWGCSWAATPPTSCSAALDMPFVQGFKAHVSTYQLATLAQVEDAATIIRQSLEVAVQAICLGRGSSKERRKRGGRFLAFLWVKWPAQLRAACGVCGTAECLCPLC
jgi:hypothetical protein